MVFTSPEFIVLFFPITLLLYYAVPQKYLAWRNVVLLLMSLVFYGWGEPLYLFLMIASILATYLFAMLVDRSFKKNDPKRAKLWLIIGVIFNVGLLGFFKYYTFIITNLLKIPFMSFLEGAYLEITLPIGISFYTFQIMSYLIDVYRHDVEAQKNPIIFGTYVSLFPQLIAGPIVKYHDVENELTKREHTVGNFSAGIKKFTVGFAKKVILANSAGMLFDTLRDIPGDERTVIGAWAGIIMYSFQLYFDFSAYSDMAIGMGKMLGFEFMENFNYPYISKSITEFWRRWHISLSTWFREYVYFPLGGSRVKTKGRMFFNLFVVWLLTGIWHGANWNFLLWGLYYFLFLVIEKLFLGKLMEKLPSFIRHTYALLIILFGWLLFYFENISEGILWLGNMFGKGTAGFISAEVTDILIRSIVMIVIFVLAATPAPKNIYHKLIGKCSERAKTAVNSFGIILLLVCIAYVISSGYNPFLYSQF